MCCGQTANKKNKVQQAATPVQQQVTPVQPVSNQSIKASPVVIPKAVKEQLIINQQLARIPVKKEGTNA